MNARFMLTSLATALALLSCAGTARAAEVTGGSIDGTVKDKNGPLPGATVSLISDQGSKTATTDSAGGFRFTYVSPGRYSLTAALPGFISVEQTDLQVRLGTRLRVDVLLTAGVSKEIEVVAASPVIDISSNTSGATITNDLAQSVPVGRTFAETLALAPGVVDSGIDNSNPSIAGASGLENTYVIDGVNIGNTGYGSAGSYSIVFGSLGTGVHFDYIEQVQIKTGGYEPEYGEALGGFVNLVTKSGGNKLSGGGYAYWQPSGLEGDRTEFDLTNAVADRSSQENDHYDIGGDIGGALVKDKVFYYGAFNPSFESVTRRTYHVLREEQGIDNTLERERRVYNYAGNIKFFLGSKHAISVSAFGDPSEGKLGGQRADSLAVVDPSTKFSELSYGGNNAVGRWNGELASNWFLEGQVAYHTDKFEETFPLNDPSGLDRRVSPFVNIGGVGFFDNAKSQNTQFKLKMSNFFEAGGEHNLRYGFEYQDIGYDSAANYTGPNGYDLVLPSGTVQSTSGFLYSIRPSELRVSRIRSGQLTAETSADYMASYISDSWNISPNLNLMLGVRWERDKLKGSVNEHEWGNNWAPRAHVNWDPTGDSKTKLGFSFGRFFGKIPNDLAVRALSTEVTHFLIYDIDSVDVSDPANPKFSGVTPSFDITFGDHPTELVEGSKITSQDEYVVTAAREVAPFFSLGATFLYRKLNRTLEDYATVPYSDLVAGTADFGNYVIGNPDTDHPDLFPEPERKYSSLTLSAERRLHDNWQLLSSYTWAKLRGNYEGYFRRDNGQSDPFITSLYDFPYLVDPEVFEFLSDSDGILPNDREHVFNLYGSYQFDMKLTAGVGFRLQSGLPITPLGYNEAYASAGEIPLAPRGADGRGDTAATFNLHFDYPISLGGSGELELIVDMFNLFNSQNGLDYDMNAEIGCAGPDCTNPDYGKVVTYQDPRQFRFAARLRF